MAIISIQSPIPGQCSECGTAKQSPGVMFNNVGAELFPACLTTIKTTPTGLNIVIEGIPQGDQPDVSPADFCIRPQSEYNITFSNGSKSVQKTLTFPGTKEWNIDLTDDFQETPPGPPKNAGFGTFGKNALIIGGVAAGAYLVVKLMEKIDEMQTNKFNRELEKRNKTIGRGIPYKK